MSDKESLYQLAAKYNEELMANFEEDHQEYVQFNQKTGLSKNDAVNYLIGIKDYKEYSLPLLDNKGDVLKIEYINKFDKKIKPENIKAFVFEGYKDLDIQRVTNADNYGSNIAFDAIVNGKDLDPYLIPQRVKLKCHEVLAKDKLPGKCITCPLSNPEYRDAQGFVSKTFSITQNTSVMVRLVKLGEEGLNGEIRKTLSIPPYNNCRQVDLEVVERITVEDVSLVSEINYDQLDADYTMIKAYVFGERTKPNQLYKLWGKPWSDSKDGKSLQVVHQIDSDRDNISKWKLSDENKAMLDLFKPKEDTIDSVQEKMDEINRDLAANVTKMKKREDVINITNMVYHSALSFNFMGSEVNKGWMEGSVLGDTRTGKTETVKTLLFHYKAGEFISSAENTSLPGLLGGLQQTTSGRWNLTWGRLPMNDKRMVVLDESDELSKNKTIGYLSGVRSSGVAELIKIQQQRTMSRTRLMFISNGFKGRVSDYNYGFDILQDLFPEQQDISRVDCAVVCKKEDVDDKEINSFDQGEAVPHVYTKEACHARVMFAWNLDKSKIEFEPECEKYILDQANKFGERYSPEVPLVIGAEFRTKLARASVSVAAQMFSWEGERLVVKQCHAQYYCRWLKKVYDSDTFGYFDYSEQIKRDRSLKETTRLDAIINNDYLIDELLNAGRMTVNEIQNIFVVEPLEARERISDLRKSNAIRTKSGYYHKTPQFIQYLKRKRKQLKGESPI